MVYEIIWCSETDTFIENGHKVSKNRIDMLTLR